MQPTLRRSISGKLEGEIGFEKFTSRDKEKKAGDVD
jgi:hypothetical protein